MVAETDTENYNGRQWWYVAGFVIALVLLVWGAMVAHTHKMAGWEVTLFRRINDWPNSWHVFFKVCSIAHNSLVIGALAVVLTFLLRQWRLTYRMSVAIITGYVIAALLKHEIARPRPFLLLHNVHLRWTDSGTGFPSGHAMVITIVMLSILPYLSKWWRWTVPVVIALVMISRVYLGLHAPLDVIGGFAVGLLVVSFMRILPQAIKEPLHLD